MQLCLSQSTAHGLANIGNAKRISAKIVWFMLTLMTTSFLIFHTYILHKQLLAEEMLVSTTPDAVPFIQPDIVLCPDRFFAKDFIYNPPADEYQFMLNVSKRIQRFNKVYGVIPKSYHSMIWDSLDTYELFKAFYHRKHELFLSIKCNGWRIKLDKIKAEMNFIHFACYRITPSLCPMKSPMDSLIVKFYMHLYSPNQTNSSINVTIGNRPIYTHSFIQKENPDEMEDGVNIYFAQPNEVINEASEKITASVNKHTSIRLKSTEFCRLPTRKWRCAANDVTIPIYNYLDQNSSNFVNISMSSMCVEIDYQYNTYKVFKCILKLFPIPANISSTATFCGNIFSPNPGRDLLFYWRHEKGKLECKYQKPCKSIIHMAKVNYNDWPRTSIIKEYFNNIIPQRIKEAKTKNQSTPGLKEAMEDYRKNPSNIKSWKRNFIKVSISPGESMSTVIEESRAYQLKNLFSDVGGLIGFYMGASLLTLFELLRLMHCTFQAVVKKTKKDISNEEQSLHEDNV